MKRFTMFACLALTLVFAMNAFAGELPQKVVGHDGVIHGGSADFAKSSRDTIFLIGPYGSGAQVNGQFEDLAGNPAWNGWESVDVTQPTDTHWQVSDYAAPNGAGNNGAWCGDISFDACDPADAVGGYGNNWNDILRFSYNVADPAANCTVAVTGVFNSNTEPGYDYVTFRFMTADAPIVKAALDGVHTVESFSYSHSYAPADYLGAGDEVQFDVLVTSDGGWSDEDCSYWGDGAVTVDDLHVTCSNGGYDATTDFTDGTFGDWAPAFPLGVGDFTNLWTGLEDVDPCNTNYSTQVAFIDDGNQVAGVGPSYCLGWCYGPGGYIVNTEGGAAGSDNHMLTDVISPVLTWPGSGYTGAELTFGVYRHEDLTADAPGIFYQWNVRSTADDVADPLENAAWLDRNFVYYGGPDYVRAGDVVSGLMEPGATLAQVKLVINELGYNWGWDGPDGYPAPYFDNVRFTAYTAFGPGMATREIDIANDNFREIPEPIDLANLALNNVRFDRCQSKAVGSEEHNIPGDSILCDVASVRVGGQLVANRLVYSMERNPVFDSVRDPLWGATGSTDGIQQGLTATYYYDLPDSGFLFPGDVLHYYFEATDEVAHADAQTATLPVDIDGFGTFDDPTAYDTAFQVHALPSVKADGSQPGIIFWNDFGARGGENEWYTALNNLGLEMGEHYDAYFTNGPSSGVGNGLGGRAVLAHIDGYTDMLYTAGDLGVNTIANGDFNNDASRDIQLLTDWFAFGPGRDAFFCGDELANDMSQAGALTSGFLNDIMNVSISVNDIRPFINNQTTPVVLPEAGNSVFFTTPSWVAYGGCFGINTFDAVTTGAGAERLARFTNPSGAADYDYSAATLNLSNDDRVITMPYDFMYIYTDAANPVGNGLSTRANVLKEILAYFQVPNDTWIESGVDTPEAGKFFASNYPNPFNPTTEIKFNMPKAGHMSLKVYNVRGELVKTLINESLAQGEGHVMWDGTNSQGSNVSSGVYFYEARTAGNVVVNKMALVK